MPRPIVHEVFGQPLTVADMAVLSGLTTSAVHVRLNRGMSALAIITTPKAPTDGVTMIGARFDKLTVLREAGYTKARKKLYECQCDCGSAPKSVVGADLRSGRTTSCGCYRKDASLAARLRGAEDLTNKVFADGWVTVLGPGEFVSVRKSSTRIARIRLWRCRCKCGTPFETKASQLRKGQTTSCGCRRRALQVQRMKDRARRFDFYGERLTLRELSEVSGVDGPTIDYRINKLEMTAEQAALGGPLRRNTQRPKGRGRLVAETP